MFYLYIPHLKLYAHEKVKPSLRFLPFVIHKNGKIIEVNNIASKKGIIPGMTLTEARKRTFSLSCCKYNENLYSQCREHILQRVFERAPYIELDNGVGAFFSTRRKLRSVDREEFARDLHLFLAGQFQTSIRIGYGQNKTVAYIAARLSEKSGYLIIEDHIASNFISMLPLSLLPGLGKRTARMLNGFGLQTIGQFIQLPIHQLISLFGSSGLQLHERARAIDERPLVPSFEPHSYTESFIVPSQHEGDIYTSFYSAIDKLKNTFLEHGTTPDAVTLHIVANNNLIITKRKKISSRTFAQFTQLSFRSLKEVLSDVASVRRVTLTCDVMRGPNKKRVSAAATRQVDPYKQLFSDLLSSSFSFSAPNA